MDKVELQTILEKHKKWLLSEDGGKRADLHEADLHEIDLCGVNLSCADLSGINLNCANLIGANLSGANLNCANLSEANLGGANLNGADLNGADLHGANLTSVDLTWAYLNGADLHAANLTWAHLDGAELNEANLDSAYLNGANLCDVKYGNNTGFYALACPEKGSFIGFKKANGKIIELMITENAKRSSATTRKCRCSEAVVLSITNLDGTKFNGNKVTSTFDESFVYEIGKTISVNDFDDNRWKECSRGIHFFLTRDEAVRY